MKCIFCGKDIPAGTGVLYAYKDGQIEPFCSLKCETNLHKLKRKPHQVKWTDRYHEEKQIRVHGKEETVKKAEKASVKPEKAKSTRAERKAKRDTKKAERKQEKAAHKAAKAAGAPAKPAAEEKTE